MSERTVLNPGTKKVAHALANVVECKCGSREDKPKSISTVYFSFTDSESTRMLLVRSEDRKRSKNAAQKL